MQEAGVTFPIQRITFTKSLKYGSSKIDMPSDIKSKS